MFFALEILTVLIVAIAMALSVAHALELPGKLRLSQEQYLAVQPIYYPGFTIGGASEPLGIVLTLVLLMMLPVSSLPYWLVAGAFIAVLAMQVTYWVMTHPVNNFWLKEYDLKGAGAGFFGLGMHNAARPAEASDWIALRNRWEISHVIRAVFGLLAFLFLAVAIAV